LIDRYEQVLDQSAHPTGLDAPVRLVIDVGVADKQIMLATGHVRHATYSRSEDPEPYSPAAKRKEYKLV
jgi:hypothetical protein